MARYTNESKERVRDAVDMIDLVSRRTELKRAGVNRLSGLCPFHDERTPSFGINPIEKVYHCFGCQASGDAFTFVMETDGVDFKEAIELLAERYNVALDVEDEDPREAEQRQRRARLLELLDRTATFYARCLWESKEAEKARAYLEDRGLHEAALREFRVGYAPSAWDTVLNGSRRAGFANTEIHAAGLAQRNERSGRLYDRFRSQIIFPLADPRGRVLGFAGRTMGGDADRRPKYINSPESDHFHKREQLFAVDLARVPAAKAGNVVVAEGYTDVIAMHQAGIRNSVAIMGTALTDEQVRELARLAKVVHLALDSDSAGQEAMVRASRLAEGRGLALRVVAMPRGEDPAEVVQRAGGEEMERRVSEALPFVHFRVRRILDSGDASTPEGKDAILGELRGVFADLPPSAMRELLLKMAGDHLSLSPELLWSLITDVGAGRRPTTSDASATARRSVAAPLGRRERQERTFLAMCVAMPQQGAIALAELDPEQDLTSPAMRAAAAHLREHLAAPLDGIEDGDPLQAVMRELTVRAGGLSGASPATLEMERLQLAHARVERDIVAARVAGEGVTELAARKNAIKSQLDRLMAEV